LSTGDFGIGGKDRRIPRVAHIAFNALDPTNIMKFYEQLFNFHELDTSFERRSQERKNRFMGDGCTNLAIHPYYNTTLEGHEPRFGFNHFGFIVSDMEDKLASISGEREVAARPATRPYAEYRAQDPEGNRFDLSYKKGWEVDIDKWENGAE
jgi:predicted enzyme related to lactoylglutathione lyase